MWKRTTSWVNVPFALGKRNQLVVYTNKVNLSNML